MQKRTKRKGTTRPAPTTAERLRREELQSYRRNVRAEQQIRRLARQLSTAIRQREAALVELHADLDNHVRRTAHGAVEPELG